MASSIKMTVNHFDRVEKYIENSSRQTLTEFGILLVAEARKRCPVDTGYLRDSIRHFVSTAWGGNHLTIGALAEYGIFVHEGTRYIRPRRFIKDAITANLGRLRVAAIHAFSRGF